MWLRTRARAVPHGRLHRLERGVKTAVVAAVLGATAACESLLEVDLPGRIGEAALDNPAIAGALVISAQGNFECFYSNYVEGSGAFTDELYTSTGFFGYNQFNARTNNASSNNTDGCVSANAFGVYLPMHRAIATADDAVWRLEAWTDQQVPNRTVLIATALAYGGYTLVMMGEGYCSGVVSSPDGTLGSELTPRQVLDLAEARFTKAISLLQAGGSAGILNMALLGRARVRARIGNKTGAAADARLIPAGYRKDATYSGANPDRENQAYVDPFRNRYLSVEPPFRNLTVGGVPDPRVKVTDSGVKGPDGLTPWWYSAKYLAPSSPIRLASWEEAQLIIAQADLGQEAVNRINAVRANYGLPLYAPANVNDATEILNQIIEERRREFFLEGHRLGDRIQFKLPWEQGVTHNGNLVFGDLYCFPLAQQERNQNPNIP